MESRSPIAQAGCWRSQPVAGWRILASGSNLSWKLLELRVLPGTDNFRLEMTTMTIETKFDSNYRKVLVAARRARQTAKWFLRPGCEPLHQSLPHRAGRDRSRQNLLRKKRCTRHQAVGGRSWHSHLVERNSVPPPVRRLIGHADSYRVEFPHRLSTLAVCNLAAAFSWRAEKPGAMIHPQYVDWHDQSRWGVAGSRGAPGGN